MLVLQPLQREVVLDRTEYSLPGWMNSVLSYLDLTKVKWLARVQIYLFRTSKFMFSIISWVRFLAGNRLPNGITEGNLMRDDFQGYEENPARDGANVPVLSAVGGFNTQV